MNEVRCPAVGPGYYVALLAATFLMASSFIAGKVLLAADVPPILLIGWRFLLAAFATLPLLVTAESSLSKTLLPRHLKFRDWLVVGLIGLLQTSATMGLLYVALRTISPGTAAILLFTNPLWVALFGHVLLGESLSGGRLLGLTAGILGVALALGASGFADAPLAGQLIALAAAICWAFATILIKRARLPLNIWALSFWQMLVGAVMLLVFAYLEGEHWPGSALASVTLWAWFLWLAVPGSTGSLGLWFVALRRGGATQTSGYLFLTPFFTVVMSALTFRTHLTILQACGGLLIGVALWLVTRRREGPRAAR